MGNGTTSLGTGQDTLIGFGEGSFDGGNDADKILFGNGQYLISGGTISSSFNGLTMNVSNFESIGGVNGGIFAFGNGTLTIANGVAVSLV